MRQHMASGGIVANMNSGKHLTHGWGLRRVPSAIPDLWLLAWYHREMFLGLEDSPVLLCFS